MRQWPPVQFGRLLTRVKDDVEIDDLATYSRVTIRMNGNGVALRDRAVGVEIGTKRQFIARSGQFILSKIDARNGAFGVVPPECDNAVVTGNFWVFDFDHGLVDPSYFRYLSRSPLFVDACVRASDGTTNRRYLQEDAFLRMEAPLPPLTEQKAIVMRLDALADKVRQVNEHLDAIEADAERLLAVRFRDANASATYRPMSEVAPLVRREVAIDPDASYTELGVKSFYKGTFHRRTVPGSDFSWQDLYLVRTGDLIFSNIMAWEQAIAIATPSDDGAVGNHRMLTCQAKPECAVPGFLWYYFATQEGFDKIYAASPGTAARNRTITAPALMAIKVPMPPIKAQRAFDALQSKVAELKAKHAEIRAANQALIPATLERVFAG
jgi:type I restriction enzyme, S subunit